MDRRKLIREPKVEVIRREENRRRCNRTREVNRTRKVHQSAAAPTDQNRIRVCTSEFKISSTFRGNLYSLSFRDDVPSTPDAHHDDSINTSASGRTHTGATSLDSSPATSDDESFRDMEGWNSVTAEMLQTLTEAEKKRQEIINGEFELSLKI